jgi:hypothetical protein
VPSRYRDTRRWCRGKEGVEHVPEFTRQRPEAEAPCYRRDDWYRLLKNDDPSNYLRYYAPWECRHRITCADCGKVLKDWPAWDLCPVLDTTAEGRELHDAQRALLERGASDPSSES